MDAGAQEPGSAPGRGLDRDWLPWVSVAAVNGILDVEALGPEVAGQVLGRYDIVPRG